MELKQLYREIVNEHNLHPSHRGKMEDADLVLQGINPSCGDDITLYFKLEGDVVKDGSFDGTGCAISQASVDMMLDQVIGESKEVALQKAKPFFGMIHGEEENEEKLEEELDEAAALKDVSHMPARVKCALLGWRTMREALEHPEKAKPES